MALRRLHAWILVLTVLFGTAAFAWTDRSVYLLDSVWSTDAGRNVRLEQLRGHYQVLAFIFTRCGSACPMLVKDLQRQVAQMPEAVRARSRLLLVTIDPEHDTQQVLRHYRRKMSLRESDWTLLRGREADVRELAAVVGFKYRRGDNDMFVHSDLITLLDPDGEIVMQHQGESGAWQAMSKRIAASLTTGS
jgi:protein SCO1